MNKALIVYASKTGTTKDVAAMLAKKLTVPAELYDCRSKTLLNCSGKQVAERTVPKIDEYGLVILGTPMYMGKPIKEFKKFLTKNVQKLTQASVAIFTCGVGTQEEDGVYLRKSLPESLKGKQMLYRHMGGEVRIEKMGGFARLAMKEYEKQHGTAAGIDWHAVDGLAGDIAARFGGKVS